jgi:hypothetical protein
VLIQQLPVDCVMDRHHGLLFTVICNNTRISIATSKKIGCTKILILVADHHREFHLRRSIRHPYETLSYLSLYGS